MVGDINHIIVIESLSNERLTGTELYTDCIRRYIAFRKSDISHAIYSPHTKKEFIELLKYIQFNSPYMNGGLLLHLEMHGANELNGLVLADRSLISWGELVDLFRPINEATCNKLYISMATCNGRWLYNGVNALRKSPYSCYISASKEVYADEIVEQFTLLFNKLIECGNLVLAYLEMEKQGTSFYYKDSESSFEDNFKNVRTNPEIRKELLDGVLADYQKIGLALPDSEQIDMILNSAFNNMYHIHKEAFDFSDCN